MSEENETGTQTLDITSDTIELRLGQEPEMNTARTEASADYLELRLVEERIKQATDLILRRVEELCAPLVGRTELESAGNREASGLKHNIEFISPSSSRHDHWHVGVRKINFTKYCWGI